MAKAKAAEKDESEGGIAPPMPAPAGGIAPPMPAPAGGIAPPFDGEVQATPEEMAKHVVGESAKPEPAGPGAGEVGKVGEGQGEAAPQPSNEYVLDTLARISTEFNERLDRLENAVYAIAATAAPHLAESMLVAPPRPDVAYGLALRLAQVQWMVERMAKAVGHAVPVPPGAGEIAPAFQPIIPAAEKGR